MKIIVIATAFALAAGTASAWAQTANPLDGQFAAMASVGNSFEIASSRLALQRASDPQVLAFARMMIADHGKAQAQLDSAAASAGTEAGVMLDADHQKMVDDLSARSGADFDTAYVTDQVAAHQESEGLLSGYVSAGTDPSLQRYAAKALPVVEMHLRRIQTLSGM